MNCTRAEKLLPLHAAGDLAGRSERAVSAHLIACDECRGLAAEFERSRSWLGGAAAEFGPEFEEEFFADLRSAVRREVAREGRQSEPRSAFALLPGWKPLVAALLRLLVGSLLTYRSFDRRRPSGAQDKQFVRDWVGKPGKPTSPDEVATRPNHPRPTRPQTGHKRARAARPPEPERGVDGLSARATRPEPAAAPDEGERAAPPDSAELPETLRIELQTADPNIRIIWFVPKETTASAARAEAETR
jgi:hypothetical protein